MHSLWVSLVLSVVLTQGLPTPTDTDESELLSELDDILTQISTTITDGPRVQKKRKDYAALVTYTCPGSKFRCGSTRVCLPVSSLCNGQAECPGSWDERPEVCQLIARTMYGKALTQENSFDKRGKPSTSSRKCRAGMVPCASSSLCIPVDYVCDGLEDCPDGTDELKCGCAQGFIQCNKTGECMTESRLCDGRADCRDGEDETEQTCGPRRCSPGTTRCPASNLCLDDSLWCDGTDHCGDGEDEDKNTCQTIPCDGLRCPSSGRCLPTERYCDGFQDCPEGEDEDISRCGPVKCLEHSAQCEGTNYCYRVPHWACDGYKDCPHGDDENETNCEHADGDINWNYIHKRTSATNLKRLLEKMTSLQN